MQRIPLKVALVERGTPTYRTAEDANITPNRLYKIIMGLQDPTESEKERLCKILNRSVADVFPSLTDTVTA